MASTGSSLDAENAGQNPDMMPMATDTPIPKITLLKYNAALDSVTLETKSTPK